MKVEPLTYHRCETEEEGFFQPKKAQAGFIGALMPQLNCFENALDLELWGNFEVTSVRTLIIQVVKCAGKETCKSEDEIREFMDEYGTLYIVYNDHVYSPNDYSSSVITKQLNIEYYPLKPNSKEINSINL